MLACIHQRADGPEVDTCQHPPKGGKTVYPLNMVGIIGLLYTGEYTLLQVNIHFPQVNIQIFTLLIVQ